MRKRSRRCLMNRRIGQVWHGIQRVSGSCSFGCWIVEARFGQRRRVRGSARTLGIGGAARLAWHHDARGPGPIPPRRRPSSSGCSASEATSLRWPENSGSCGSPATSGLIKPASSPGATSAGVNRPRCDDRENPSLRGQGVLRGGARHVLQAGRWLVDRFESDRGVGHQRARYGDQQPRPPVRWDHPF